jgi:WD40 repeat protein
MRKIVLVLLILVGLAMPRIAPTLAQDQRPVITRDNVTLLQEIGTFYPRTRSINNVAVSPDNDWLVAAESGVVELWNIPSGDQIPLLEGSADAHYDVAFSPDGQYLAVGGGDSTNAAVWVWDNLSSQITLAAPSGSTDTEVVPPSVVAFSSDGRYLAAANSRGAFKLWEVGTFNELPASSCGSPFGIWQVSFNATLTLAACAEEGTVSLVGVTNRDLYLQNILIQNNRITTLAFSPDSRQLAVGIWNSPAEIFDTQTGASLYTLNTARPAAWNFDGTLLAASQGTAVQLWDMATRTAANALGGDPSAFTPNPGVYTSSAFSPDGTLLVTGIGSQTDVLRLWGVPPGSTSSTTTPSNGNASLPPSSGSSASFTEEFTDPIVFSQTSGNVYISAGRVYWTIARNGGTQYVYRAIPAFSGDMRLTVTGEIDNWDNNCGVWAGIGDNPGDGTAIQFGWTGGGCPGGGDAWHPPSPFVSAIGVTNWNFGENNCQYWGDWQRIGSGTPYTAVLTIQGDAARLSVPGSIAGVDAVGVPTYTGTYDTLYVGYTGDGDWPSCSGIIDSIKVEPLGDPALTPGPDVRVLTMTVSPQPLVANQPFTANITVANVGNRDAGRFAVAMVIQPGNLFFSSYLEGIPAEQATQLTFSDTLRATGPYSVTFVTDLNNEVAETDESNNTTAMPYEIIN